jgi:hypothetical protein
MTNMMFLCGKWLYRPVNITVLLQNLHLYKDSLCCCCCNQDAEAAFKNYC